MNGPYFEKMYDLLRDKPQEKKGKTVVPTDLISVIKGLAPEIEEPEFKEDYYFAYTFG